jgi:hypothetical protein
VGRHLLPDYIASAECSSRSWCWPVLRRSDSRALPLGIGVGPDTQGHTVSVVRIDFTCVCPWVLDSRTCAMTIAFEAALSVRVAR